MKEEDKKAQWVANSIIVTNKLTQMLLNKQYKVNFATIWSQAIINATKDRFHNSFATSLKVLIILWGQGLKFEWRKRGCQISKGLEKEEKKKVEVHEKDQTKIRFIWWD